ncbi:MAG: hypothetical protein J6M60_07495 [Clostridia bacterium]|nr:hypothetical protein [Clostridia bacterium]
MSKSKKSPEDILRDALKIKDVMHKKIVEKELKIGRRLTKEEKNKVKDGIRLKYRIGKAVGLGLIVLGIGSSVNNALPKGSEIVEAKTVNENTAERDNFVKELQVESSTITIVDINKETEDIRNFLKEEIEGLDTEEKVLDYLKEFYINEYNVEKDTGYTVDQVKFDRSRQLVPTYEKEWVLTATIHANGRFIDDSAYKDYTGCHTCEVVDRDVIEAENDDFMSYIAPVISAGISRKASMLNEDTSYQKKEKYKNDFINEMTDYVINYKGPTYDRIMGQIQEKSNQDNEIGD